MRKIPTLFVRDWDGDRRYVLPEVTPECQWVIDGEGTATRKYDGTCLKYAPDGWWARREVKENRTAPASFQPVAFDSETGKTVGWMDANESGFMKYLAEALDNAVFLPYGTYELCGPKINGNPENYGQHVLVSHANAEILRAPRSFDELRVWLHDHDYEGIVWHHEDGRMAKIKKRDFRAPEVSG
jgi:hypothetical protein